MNRSYISSPTVVRCCAGSVYSTDPTQETFLFEIMQIVIEAPTRQDELDYAGQGHIFPERSSCRSSSGKIDSLPEGKEKGPR